MSAPRPPRRLLPALGLVVLAPLVGEFLLGNLPITWLWLLLPLALLYGCGALLIRESARRAGLGWPTVVPLGLAYGVIEEAFVTQSLFNPSYLGLRLLDFGYIPALGIGAWWTVYVLGLHTVWSTTVPIALVEAATPAARRTPWLGSIGLGITAALFTLGCVLVAHAQPPAAVHASSTQLAASAGVAVLLIVLAFVIGRRPRRSGIADEPARPAPSPLVVGAVALACGSAFMIVGAIVQARIPAGASVAGMLAALVTLAVALLSWSRGPGSSSLVASARGREPAGTTRSSILNPSARGREPAGRTRWSARQVFGAACGLALTYTWYAFVQTPSVGQVSPQIDRLGDLVFAVLTVSGLALTHVRVARHDQA